MSEQSGKLESKQGVLKSQGAWERRFGIKSQQDPKATTAIFFDGDYAGDLIED